MDRRVWWTYVSLGLVIGSYVTGMTFLEEERLEMVRYLFNHAHADDGGWGLYVLFSISIPLTD